MLKMRMKSMFIPLVVFAGLGGCLALQCKSNEETPSQSVSRIVNDIAEGDRLAGGRLQQLARQRGGAVVPELAGYLSDVRNDVRWRVTIALGSIPDAASVPPLAGCLRDSDKNVWAQGDGTIQRVRQNFSQSAKYYDANAEVYIRCSEYYQWYNRLSIKNTGTEDSGLATGGSNSTLTDTSKAWGADGWVPGLVAVDYSVEPWTQYRRVSSNTSTQLTVSPNWSENPTLDTSYDVQKKLTWEAWTQQEVSGDNVTGSGTTNITWDLQ